MPLLPLWIEDVSVDPGLRIKAQLELNTSTDGVPRWTPLLPADWVGFAAYELCRELYARVFHAAQTHLVAHARRLRGPLPPMDPATYDRFGGLPRADQSVPSRRRMPFDEITPRALKPEVTLAA